MKTLRDIAIWAVMLLSLASCDNDMKLPVAKGDGMVNMVLSVKILDPDQSGTSRAGDETYFEPPTTRYEKLHTIRYIIVRPSGKVEHNYLFTSSLSDMATEYVNQMAFGVVGGETKQVYLIGNEAAVSGFDFSSIVEGSYLDADELSGIELAASGAAAPLYDNSDESTAVYLPMAEQFAVDVQAPSEGSEGPTYQYQTLFLTRTTVKFSLSAIVSPVSTSDITLKNVTFRNIGDRQYLLPRNTTYSPEKYPADASDRIITDYEVPAGAVNSPLSFDLNWEYPAGTSTGMATSPAIYFPETKMTGPFGLTVTIGVKGNGEAAEEDYVYEVDMPNLPSLPRNTHVKIDMTLTDHQVACHVDVAPYIGVYLKPSFGFTDLFPGHASETP